MQLGSVGAGLPYPAKNFPGSVATGQRYGLAVSLSDNAFALPAGGVFQVPPGNYFISGGMVQWLDPVTGLWRTMRNGNGDGPLYVNSDGTNYRVWNPLGLPVGALVTNVGSSYVQSSTTVTSSGSGGSTWRAIVGGAINTTVTVGADAGGTTGGTNWTYPPIVVFDAPPAGGVPATGYAAVSAGAVSSITVVDQGAGYASAPGVNLYPNPLDPNLGTITIPACTAALTGSGEITAVLPVLPGTVLTAAPTLTINGVGSSATATAIMALTVATLTVTGGTNNHPVMSVGGLVTTAAGAIANPSISTGLFIPRPFLGYESGATTGVIIDGGLFQVAPAAYSPGGGTDSFTMGSTDIVVVMQLVPGT